MSQNATIIKSRLRSFFERDSTKPKGMVAIVQHFSDVKLHNLNYHLKTLVDEGFLVRPKRGLYQKSPSFQSPEDKRAAVTEHLKTNGSPIQSGALWRPGDEPLKEVVNPAMLSYLGRSFGDSIVCRMKSSGFTPSDVSFVEGLLQRLYPLSEQQRTLCERFFAGLPTGTSLVSSNGRSGNGSS